MSLIMGFRAGSKLFLMYGFTSPKSIDDISILYIIYYKALPIVKYICIVDQLL